MVVITSGCYNVGDLIRMSDIRQYLTLGSKRPNGSSISLPDPSGPLSKEIPSSAIRVANKEVSATLEKKRDERNKRGPYRTKSLKLEEKTKIARYASIHGTTAAI